MHFHLGKPVLALAALALIAGLAIAVRRPVARAAVEVWTFAPTHADAYASRQADLRRAAGGEVAIRVTPSNALNVRLVSLFLANQRGPTLPDIVEIRQDAIGRYLGAPADQVPLYPLNQLLDTTGERTIRSTGVTGQLGWIARCTADGKLYRHTGSRWEPAGPEARPDHWRQRLNAARLQAYTRDGQIFGLPRDVHPVALLYRHDLFTEAGIDLELPSPDKSYVTWADFQQRCLRFQQYWRAKGVDRRWAMDLFSANADMLNVLLLQRGINLIDAAGRVHLTDPEVLETLLTYVDWVAGSGRISDDSVSAGLSVWKRDLEAGLVCAAIMPDWRIADLRSIADSHLAGKFRLCRLPRFSDSDSPTSTWGGTMIALPRHASDPARAWKVVEELYLNETAVAAQIGTLGILPATDDAGKTAASAVCDPLFAGQAVQQLYAELAMQLPRQELTANSAYATSALSYVLSQCVAAARSGVPTTELRSRASEWLASRQADVERQMAHQRLAATIKQNNSEPRP